MSVRDVQNHPRGQAAIEALMIIIFGFMLVMGVHHLGQMRSESLHLLGESYFLSFLPQKIVNVLGSSSITERHATVRLAGLTYSAQQREIEQQLGVDSTTLLRASASSVSRVRSNVFTLDEDRQIALARHSFLLSGVGQAESSQAAQAQIAGSAMLWQESFVPSQQLVNSSALSFEAIDRAWGRPKLTSEWLLPWANEVLAPEPLWQTSVLQQPQTISQSLRKLFK